ncbi:MAG: helix-turn-helix domain-containing protein [Solirubrobacteraceae bacterium]
MGQERASGPGVLAKASAILDCLERGPELTAGQLAARTGEPRSTTYRLLDSLRDLGFVEPGSGSGPSGSA